MRRIPDFTAEKKKAAGQGSLFDVWRFHGFFTTTDPSVMDTVTADKTHRGHAIVEQVIAALKNGPLAHLPSGSFWANSAWLVLATMSSPRASRKESGSQAPDTGQHQRTHRALPDSLRYSTRTLPRP